MAIPWGHPVYGWAPSPSYYSPGYWQYVPVPYPIYPPAFHPPQFQGEFVQQNMLPPIPRQELQLHRFLGGQRRLTAVWDISQPPLKARRKTSHDSLEPVTRQLLDQPATNPPVKSMRIACDSSRWNITIKVPPRHRDKFITIRIVLDAIYGTLHEPLGREEWREIHPAAKRNTYGRMLDRLRHNPPSMRADGFALRIDTLLDKTQFVGLRQSGANPEEWILLLGPTRRPD